VVARRNGKVFISGNSQYPFSNLSFDWVPPLDLRNQKAIVGGREMAYTYGDLQKEMDMINKAFLEVMLEGDAKGGVFTFPIPTYNITKDFDWDSENANLLFDLTAKYGLPYFQNYVGSGLDPRSIRAMCLHPEESIVVRANGRITKTNIGEFAKSHSSGFDAEGWSIPDSYVEAMSLNSETMKLEWKPIKNIVRSPTKSMISIKARDGKRIRVSPNHPVSVLTPDGIIEKPACSISVGDFIISMKSGAGCLSADRQKTGSFELDEDMAMLLGFFIADGNFLFENRKEMAAYGKERGIQLTFPGNCDYASETISLFERKLGTKARLKNDPRYGTLYAYFYNAKVSRELSAAGLKKHGGVPPQIWNSPEGVIRAFLDGFFLGDGYEKRGEIHINDEKLAEELVMLYHMVGQPVTFRKLERSQVITLQHSKERKSSGLMGNPSLSQRVPSWGVNTAKVPGLTHNRCVNLLTLEHYGAHTELTRALMTAEVYPVRVTGVELVDLDAEEYFYDIEMEENHRFVHSLGTVTHNCCRLNLNQKELMSRPGGMWGPGDSTGSIGVVTINVNRLAYEARKAAEGMKTDDLSAKARENYFEKLKYFMVLAKNSLEVKREVVEKNLAGGLMPYTKRYLGTFKNHFSTIGICGMNEACLNLLGKDIASAEGKQLAIDTLKFMREMCLQFQNDTKSLYNLEATPAESTAYRFARLDRKMYPDIITSGRKEPYLTNSTQLPVDYGEDAVMAIEHQNDIQPLYTGGTIFHLFLGERMTSGEACKKLVRKICENTRLPYFSITPTFSICPEHGYIRGEHFTCPMEAEDSDESVELAKAR
jgi:ribonucleoside-triphosphate reductase